MKLNGNEIQNVVFIKKQRIQNGRKVMYLFLYTTRPRRCNFKRFVLKRKRSKNVTENVWFRKGINLTSLLFKNLQIRISDMMVFISVVEKDPLQRQQIKKHY